MSGVYYKNGSIILSSNNVDNGIVVDKNNLIYVNNEILINNINKNIGICVLFDGNIHYVYLHSDWYYFDDIIGYMNINGYEIKGIESPDVMESALIILYCSDDCISIGWNNSRKCFEW